MITIKTDSQTKKALQQLSGDMEDAIDSGFERLDIAGSVSDSLKKELTKVHLDKIHDVLLAFIADQSDSSKTVKETISCMPEVQETCNHTATLLEEMAAKPQSVDVVIESVTQLSTELSTALRALMDVAQSTQAEITALKVLVSSQSDELSAYREINEAIRSRVNAPWYCRIFRSSK